MSNTTAHSNTRAPILIRRALISVSDKTGVIDFARTLVSMSVEILSTGGTYRLLREHNIAVTEVSDYTGFPEMMDGRVKTLHPKIHGGILGRRGIDDAVMQQHAIQPIDMVVVNLYPFESTVAKPDCALADAIENIDIGGPTMVRSAAKNHRDVVIVVNAGDYAAVLDEMQQHAGAVAWQTRFDLAVKAFEHTAAYDGMIANWLGGLVGEHVGDTTQRAVFPRTINLQFQQAQTLRYGENPHQSAAFYREAQPRESSVATAHQWQGKELSYNNIADTDAAIECVKSFVKPACVIVKHANPCGVAVSLDGIGKAYELAYQTDPESAFGGIIAFNRELDAATAHAILEQQFVEVIVAPAVSEAARAVCAAKQNIRVLEIGAWPAERPQQLDYKRVNGGLLVQNMDTGMITEWIAILAACAGRTRLWPGAALAAAVPAVLRAAFRVEPSSFASGWPVALPVLLVAGALLAFARAERRETAAIAWAGLVPIILLSSLSLAELFPLVNYAVLPVESHAERLGRLAEAASWNHRLVLLGTLAAWAPLGLVRPRAALAAIPATTGVALCSHDAIFAIMVRAYAG